MEKDVQYLIEKLAGNPIYLSELTPREVNSIAILLSYADEYKIKFLKRYVKNYILLKHALYRKRELAVIKIFSGIFRKMQTILQSKGIKEIRIGEENE